MNAFYNSPCIYNNHGKNRKVNRNRPILCFDLLLDPKIILTIPFVPVDSTTSSSLDLGILRLLDGYGDPLRRSIPILTHLPSSAARVWHPFQESLCRCNEVSLFPIHPHESNHNRIQFVRRIRSEGEEITTLVQLHMSEESFWENTCCGLDNADETEAGPVELFRRSNRSEVKSAQTI